MYGSSIALVAWDAIRTLKRKRIEKEYRSAKKRSLNKQNKEKTTTQKPQGQMASKREKKKKLTGGFLGFSCLSM
jgi:hypothetical protein